MKARRRPRLGQHFLEGSWIGKVVGAIGPSAGDAFLEIGAGRGALTRPLAAAACSVVAFEIDRRLAAALAAEALPRVSVVAADFLGVTAAGLRAELRRASAEPASLRVAGNLPYSAASPILFKLIDLYDEGLQFADATLMLQREVADRLLARPGTREYGVLGVLVGHRARVERLLELPPGAFRPPPKVRSTVVRLAVHAPDPLPCSLPGFRALVRAVFTRRRKTLANALTSYPAGAAARDAALEETGIDPGRRPETLAIAELVRLSDAIERRQAGG
jgi:16S rRNA (adenine1518-N6/adenine1519-N6)-dimethyltransferase